MRTRRLLSLIALLATAALIGCGGSDEPSADDAKTSYESVQSRLSDLGAQVGRQLQAGGDRSDAEIKQGFDDLQQQAQDATQQLRDLDVPGELADERDALRDAVASGTDDLSDIVAAIRDADVAAASDAAQRLVRDTEAISDARQAFERALDEATR